MLIFFFVIIYIYINYWDCYILFVLDLEFKILMKFLFVYCCMKVLNCVVYFSKDVSCICCGIIVYIIYCKLVFI